MNNSSSVLIAKLNFLWLPLPRRLIMSPCFSYVMLPAPPGSFVLFCFVLFFSLLNVYHFVLDDVIIKSIVISFRFHFVFYFVLFCDCLMMCDHVCI